MNVAHVSFSFTNCNNLLPSTGICTFCNGPGSKVVLGMHAHVKLLQKLVLLKYCNGHRTMDVHGMKMRMKMLVKMEMMMRMVMRMIRKKCGPSPKMERRPIQTIYENCYFNK